MVHFLIVLDTKLFLFFNSTIANPFFDAVMPFITHLHNWSIPIALFAIYLGVKQGKKGRIALGLILITLLFTDQISSFVLKPWVGRVRPCHVLENIRLLVNCGGKFSFPSSHATNMAGFAVILTFFYRRYWYFFWGMALLIGFSRIYVGVHYPGDVFFGLLIGGSIGWLVFFIYQKAANKYFFLKIQGASQ